MKDVQISDQQVTKAQDNIKVDDAWLKISKVMYESSRLQNQNDRLVHFRTKNVEDYNKLAIQNLRLKSNITKKAGEILCTYMDIDQD